MEFFKKTIKLCGKLILEPSQVASDMFQGERTISGPGFIFIVSSIVNAYLLYIKPVDFPSEFSEKILSISKKSFFYYLSVDLLTGVFFAGVFSGFFVLFSELIKNSRLSIKLPVLVFLSGIFSILTFYFKDRQIMSILISVAILSTLIYRSFLQKNNFIAFLKFILASNIIVLIASPLCLLAILCNLENVYVFSSAVAGIWILVLLIKAAKVIAGGTALRQTIALFFSGLITSMFVYMLKNAGVINSETLKFILFI